MLISNDEEDAKMLAYMKEEQMPWPAVPLATLNRSPILLGYVGAGIPQLVIVDRYGKTLANSFERGRNVDPRRTMQALSELLASDTAK